MQKCGLLFSGGIMHKCIAAPRWEFEGISRGWAWSTIEGARVLVKVHDRNVPRVCFIRVQELRTQQHEYSDAQSIPILGRVALSSMVVEAKPICPLLVGVVEAVTGNLVSHKKNRTYLSTIVSFVKQS